MSIRGRRSLEVYKSNKDSHIIKPSLNRARSEIVSNTNKRLPIYGNSAEVFSNQSDSNQIILDSFQNFKDLLKMGSKGSRTKKSQKELNKEPQNEITTKETQNDVMNKETKNFKIQEQEIEPKIQVTESEIKENKKEPKTKEIGPLIKEVEPFFKQIEEPIIKELEEPLIKEVEEPIIREVKLINQEQNSKILENESNNLNAPIPSLKKRRPLRMLFLHGYKMNVRSFYEETDYIRNEFDDLVEFTYVQAPHFISEECAETNFQEQHAWWLKTKEFPWIHFPKVFEKTMEFMNRVFIMEGPFDGIFGYSQGGALTAILCNIITNKPFGNRYNAIDFKFAIVVGTFRYDEEYLWQFYDSEKKLQMPTFHIFGRADTVIPWQSSYDLTHFFHNPKVFFHEQGHCIPYESLPDIRTFLEDLEIY